ncbi:MAG TPA: hypothetical protein PLG50_15105 [bacterium]|nr:hypothetical protein [bacterium]HQG46986.1 hypothetical protein [bacterium]HQI47076.1 hypothetical protein [bacterium]HQJ65367.1 hypothetical protein [bacterium]
MKRNSRRTLWILAALLALLSTSLWLPNPPWIEDALTQQPAAGYSVHIPRLHLLFEPLLGPLFFFSRADTPLPLVLWLLFWLCAAILSAHAIKALQSGLRPADALANGLRKGLFWLPVTFILVVGVLLIFLFSPLPDNTITGHGEDIVLVNFHSHSYYSHDGLISPLRLLRWHKRNGFDAFFLTEHNTHTRTLNLVAEQRAGRLEGEPLIITGEEYSGSNHLLLLGLTRDFHSKDYSDQAAIDSAHAQGGVALLAHWFSPQRNTRPLADYIAMGVDGFEIANQAEGIFYPERYLHPLRQSAAEHGLLLTGNADYHGYGPACFAWNALHLPGWRQLGPTARVETVLNLLRGHDQSRLQILLYRDRQPIAPGLAWISPFITLLDYFRSLHFAQVLSWLAWLVLALLFIRYAPRIPERLRIALTVQEVMAITGAAAAAITLFFGLWMLGQIPFLAGENEIFFKDGLWLSGAGILLFLYCIYALKKLKKIQIF